MGDFRASIKIEFSMLGIERKTDMWINWSPEEGWGSMDRRVVEFFEEATLAAYNKYKDDEWEADKERRDREAETQERAEYERLAAKFGANATGTPSPSERPSPPKPTS